MAAALQRANAMDFDDLLLHPLAPVRGAARPPAGAGSDRFRFLLVDEYQDTNRAQYQFLRALRRGTATSSWSATTTSPSTAGAAPTCATSSSSSEDFPGAQLVRLEENYRSTRVDPRGGQRVIAPNTRPARQDAAHPARRAASRITVVRGGGRARRGGVAGAGIRHAGAPPRTAGLREMACSTAPTRRRAPSRRRCAARGVPYRVVGAVSFYERREVKDLLAYLRLVANPADDEAFLPRRRACRGAGSASTSLARPAAARRPVAEAAARDRRGRRPGAATSGPTRATPFAGTPSCSIRLARKPTATSSRPRCWRK